MFGLNKKKKQETIEEEMLFNEELNTEEMSEIQNYEETLESQDYDLGYVEEIPSESGKNKNKDKFKIENEYESMNERDLFLLIREDILYGRTGISPIKAESELEKKQYLYDISLYVDKMYKISPEKRDRFLDYLNNYLFGYHVLTPLMADENVSDIKVLAWDNVRVKVRGKRLASNVKFWSDDDYKNFIEMIAVKNGINLSNLNAIQTFTDKKSSDTFIFRYNISTEVVNSTERPYLQIRKVPKEKKSLEELVQLEMLSEKQAEYLKKRMLEGYVILCGKGSAGKTTLLNALIDKLPHDCSVLAVQENEELFTEKHPDMMFQHIVQNKGENKVTFGLKELIVNGLLVDLDYIIVGEIKGGEALYFLNASLTGYLGLATLHGNNASDALEKLADYAKWESSYDKNELLKMLCCIKTVVFLKNFKVA